MFLGSALITLASLPYFDFQMVPPFMLEKLPLRFERLWLLSLRLHVASALLTFPLCLALTARWLQRRAAWHRWIGRFTGVAVLGALVPSGVILAFDAKGGGSVTAGFLLSAAIVVWAMVAGVLAARRRDLLAHARAMRHVVAQMSVAVTSRALLMALDLAEVDPELAYTVALWGPVIASAAVAELVSRRPVSSLSTLFYTIQRICRETVSPAPLRIRAVRRSVARIGR